MVTSLLGPTLVFFSVNRIEARLTGADARSRLILIGDVFYPPVLTILYFRASPYYVGLLERFHESLQKKCELLDEGSVHLIRAVAPRIDSFFTRTAQIMRRIDGECLLRRKRHRNFHMQLRRRCALQFWKDS